MPTAPQLREDIGVHLGDGYTLQTVHYAGPGSIVWLTRDAEVDYVLADDAPGLDTPLDSLVDDGWRIHTFVHRGDSKAAAILTR